MSKTEGRPSRRGIRARQAISSDSSDMGVDFNTQLAIQMSLAMTKSPKQSKIQKRTRTLKNKREKSSKKVPSTPRGTKKMNTSIIELDDSDDEYNPFAPSKANNISKRVQEKVDTFFKSSGLISDDESELTVAVDAKINASKQDSDLNEVCPTSRSVAADTNDSIIVLEDDTNGINSLKDIENYCKETEDLIKNANALLEKFAGTSYDKVPQSTNPETSSRENISQEKGLGECPICYDKLSEKQVMSTKCGHLFCKDCIGKIVSTVKKCPTCRKAVNKKNIIAIYI